MTDIFKNPPVEFRGKPFWAWNGKLCEEELKRQIDIIDEMGFGGFFMHSRVGLVTEYLGEEWFDLTNKCADYGEAKGLEGWLYDEDRWPSGSAGGIATEDHENRAHFITMRKDKLIWSDDVICAFSCRLDGLNVYDIKRLSYGEEPSGDVLWFEITEMKESPNYNGTAYLDTMSETAVDNFLATTHEKYREKCGERLGTSIKGIFTDEPHRGGLMLNQDNMGASVPYTPVLFETFKDRWGYDLRDRLPELFLRPDGNKVHEVKWQYCETAQQLFLDNFMKRISGWCKNNNMKFTGHLLHEDTLSSQTIMNGSLMRSYEYMDCPGVDVLTEHDNNYNIVKQLSSVAHQCGKKWLLSELYGCTGWQMNFESYKNIGDWQALMGINLRCPHLSWYTMAGEGKRDYPASIFYQSAWYREYSYLENYFSRLGVFGSMGEPLCDTLVINPIESVWCQIYENWATWLNSVSEDVLSLEAKFDKLYHFLLSENIEFDYGDEEMLGRLGSVEDGVLKLGLARYRKVVVADMLTIRSTTLSLLKEFEDKGGKVVVLGDAPKFVDARAQSVSLGNAGEEVLTEGRVMYVDNPHIYSSVKVSPEGDYYIMLLNIDKENEQKGKITLPTGGVQLWNPATGDKTTVERPDDISLCPGEMRLYVVGKAKGEPGIFEELPEIRLSKDFEYSTDEPNVCVVERAKCTVSGETFEDDILKIDRRLREKCKVPRRGGEMYQPWYAEKKGIKSYFDISLEFAFKSEIEFDGELAMEQADKFTVSLNGDIISKVNGFWIDTCFDRLPIHVKKGKNTIVLKTTYRDDTNLEALYILGDFGVYDCVIKEKPKSIDFGDITKQGFQFYGGKIAYTFNQKVEEKSKLVLNNLCGAGVVSVNGNLIGWQPYEAEVEPADSIRVELVLTRRNTFGPLHLLPAVDFAYGPDSFVSYDEHWSETPVVLPCGLDIN